MPRIWVIIHTYLWKSHCEPFINAICRYTGIDNGIVLFDGPFYYSCLVNSISSSQYDWPRIKEETSLGHAFCWTNKLIFRTFMAQLEIYFLKVMQFYLFLLINTKDFITIQFYIIHILYLIRVILGIQKTRIFFISSNRKLLIALSNCFDAFSRHK